MLAVFRVGFFSNHCGRPQNGTASTDKLNYSNVRGEEASNGSQYRAVGHFYFETSVAIGQSYERSVRRSGMTKIEEWLTVPWFVVFVWMMIWTPKTRKGWYVAFFVIGCQIAILLYIRSNSN
jgi:hypothetical protein